MNKTCLHTSVEVIVQVVQLLLRLFATTIQFASVEGRRLYRGVYVEFGRFQQQNNKIAFNGMARFSVQMPST